MATFNFSEESQFIFDLEKTVKRYADHFAARHETSVDFVDISAEHALMQERGVYKRFKLTVTATNMEFGDAIGEHRQPTQVYTTTFTNRQRTDAIYSVSHSYTNTESAASKLVKGFQTNYKTTFSIGAPLIASVGGSYSFQYSLSKTKSDIHTKIETLKIEVKVAVPSNKTVQVTWYVINNVVDFPWTATVIVRGRFAVWFDRKVDDHHLWFFPASVLAHIDANLTIIDRFTVSFEAEGFFRKVATHDSRVFTYELESSRRATPATSTRPKKFITPFPLQ
ncbi:uncharacterized protein LOC8033874 [Ixodes scapularis]|uniref:uncharacterized protein LOC8033874 n=1 Tax=Ixodes scapularis TaxID=6945 RepID=UPI001C394FC2|nr:uncharacterized protein LOC8033874 [Ixodes scapularis]